MTTLGSRFRKKKHAPDDIVFILDDSHYRDLENPENDVPLKPLVADTEDTEEENGST